MEGPYQKDMVPHYYPWSVETLRLRLHEFTVEDVPHMYELESLPEVARYQDWEPRTREQAAAAVEATIKHQSNQPRTIIELALTVKGEDVFIGRVGASISYSERKADLWYVLTPRFQGKGFAQEAVKALIQTVLLEGLAIQRCEIECDPRNTGSWRLAERLGFEKIKDVEKAYQSKGEWVGSRVYAKDFKI